MQTLSPKAELATIRDQQRRLRQREAEILARMHGDLPEPGLIATQARPGWPMQRLSDQRAT